MKLDPKALALPWTTETDLPYGEQPRIYDATGALVAVVGNAEIEKQDDWERNAAAIVRAVNAPSTVTPAEVGGLVDTLRSMSHDDNTRACVSVNITVSNDLAKKLFDVLHAAPKAATALEAQAAELAAVKEMYAREGAKALYELERAERAEAQLAEARKALEAVQEADVRVKPLEWEEVTAARSNEDPRREPTGDYEAVSPIGVYYIEQYFGSDSYGWRVTLHGSDDVADKDDPDDAKAAAQADYERRILAALEASPAPVSEECATDGCSDPATVRFERGGVGSKFCHSCYLKVQALAAKGGQ